MTSSTSDNNLSIAAIRNKLTHHRVDKPDLDELHRLISQMHTYNGPFSGLIASSLNACVRCIELDQFDDAAAELSLIHNLPTQHKSLVQWDEDHFYKIEVLRYLEVVSDPKRIRAVIQLIAQGQADVDKQRNQ